MRRRSGRGEALGASLFPFLAVLICTMGALIVLLVVITRQARLEAAQTDEPPADERITVEEYESQLELVQFDLELLSQSRHATATQLQDEQLRLSGIEAHNRELGRLDGVLRGNGDTDSNDLSMVQEPFNAAAVDGWWQRQAARDPEAAMAALPGLVQRTGLVPAGLRNGIRAVILDGAPAVKVSVGQEFLAVHWCP